jgi:hypothetical protein
MNLNTSRAKQVIAGIFTAMEMGAYLDRAKIVRRFRDGGYCDRLAERAADALIAANTDIQHWSRWSVWGTGDSVTYSFTAVPTFGDTPMFDEIYGG